MTKTKLYALSVLCLVPLLLAGQEMLTTDDAVRIMMENNYGIKLASQQIILATNNTSRELNGYLPVVDANVGPAGAFGGSTQNFNSGMSAEVRNAFSWSIGASVTALYTLYDQTRDVRVEQLKEILNLTDLQKRQTIEDNLFQLYSQYYFIAQLSENLRALEETLEVSQKRLERARVRYEYSQGIGLDILNAQVDIDRDSINYVNAQVQWVNARRNLNVIMGSAVDREYDIDPAISYAEGLTKESILEAARANNVQVLLSNQNQVINETELRLIDAGRKPRISSNGGVSYNYQGNPSGSFIQSSSATNLNLGVSLNWNLFDGGRRKALEQNTKIAMEQESLVKEQVLLNLERDIGNAWAAYENALFVLEVERNSLKTNQMNLERTEELFNRGQVTSVEFRQAQLNLLNSETGFNSARYDVKLIEIELLYLSGELIGGG